MIELKIDWLLISILFFGYLFTFLSSSLLVRRVVASLGKKKIRKKIDTGFVVGICENFIVITFILANEITGLALIFTAKTIVRYPDISKEPEYYLAGTMVNFSFSIFMAIIIKYLIASL